MHIGTQLNEIRENVLEGYFAQAQIMEPVCSRRGLKKEPLSGMLNVGKRSPLLKHALSAVKRWLSYLDSITQDINAPHVVNNLYYTYDQGLPISFYGYCRFAKNRKDSG